MPESRPFARWRGLGRILPRDVRERIFEPALADLTYGWLTNRDARGRLPFGLHALGTYLGCLPAAGRGLFVRGGRLTRLGRVTVWTIAVVTVLGFALVRLAQSYD